MHVPAIALNSGYDILGLGIGVMKVDPAEAFDVFDFELSQAEVAALTALERGGRVSSHPDDVN